MGRMQKGEYDSPVRIYGRIIVGAYRIRPYAMHLSQKLMAKLMVYHKMFHTRV